MVPPGIPSLVLALAPAFQGKSAAVPEDPYVQLHPGPVPADVFHPDRDRAVKPRRGGSVTVYVPTRLSHIAYPLSNSTYARDILYELHETLVQLDWESWEFRGVLAESWDTEDTLILSGGERLFGRISPLDDGDGWTVTPVSPHHPLSEPRRVPAEAVEKIERGTVLTFHLRHDVRWHDGHAFDADDVVFSWSIYQNPYVECDSLRSNFQKIVRAERLDDFTVRFHYAEQYFKALDLFRSFIILPAHLYDLRSPEYPHPDPDADDEAAAKVINENPHNTNWVGVGPYRLVSASPELYEAERWDGYFDPDHGGWLDRIRWRHIQGFDVAFQALKNGELDFSAWLSSEMYFGPATQDEAFTKHFYKGYYYVGLVGYSAWNMQRPHLSDVRVRKALCHAFDHEEYLRTVAHGLGYIPTGTQAFFSPAYNHDIEPLKYDPELARELLAEAGWYDRDGDGWIDKDGVPFVLHYSAVAGNGADLDYAQRMQRYYAEVGIQVDIEPIEYGALIQKILDRDFDVCTLAWSLPLESNQSQLWHSRNAAPGVRGGNRSGVADPYVDELLEKGERELNREKRYAIWKELQRYLYEDIQPYMYRVTPPRKFAMNRRIRGFQAFSISPGYSIRRWFSTE